MEAIIDVRILKMDEELTPEELEELESLVYREPNETDNIFQTGEYTSGTIQRMTTDRQAGVIRRR